MYSRFLTIFLLLLAAAIVHTRETAEQRLDAIQAGMRNTRTLLADFTQKKTLGALKHELLMQGEIAIDRRGRMAWRILSPIRCICIVDQNGLSQWDEDSDRVITIRTEGNPALKMLSDSMRAYFSGDFASMRKDFDISEEKDGSLLLTPHGNAVAAQFIRSIVFVPAQDLSHIREIRFTETNSDSAVITFRNVRLNQQIPDEKWLPNPR